MAQNKTQYYESIVNYESALLFHSKWSSHGKHVARDYKLIYTCI